jgi:hypothetical protein
MDTEQSVGTTHLLSYIGRDILLVRSCVLNSCIEVSNYNEPYSLCQPPSSLPDPNPWFDPGQNIAAFIPRYMTLILPISIYLLTLSYTNPNPSLLLLLLIL